MSQPQPHLQVTDSLGRRVVAIDKPVFTIGRRSTADLQVVSTDVSRDHADISQDNNRYILRDRGSRYGTFVNGENVTERALTDGDRIRLGRSDAVELLFVADAGDTSGLRDPSSGVADLRQMAGLLTGLRALGSGRVLDEVLTLVLDSALDVTSADRGFIMLANETGQLEFKIARANGHVTLPGTTFATSHKIPHEVFQTGQSKMVGDLMDSSHADIHGGTIALGIRHVLCVPLRIVRYVVSRPAASDENKIIGVLYLDGREKATLLSRATRTSLETFATEAALAIESARLYAESAEKARLERDLRVAAEIQRALLPEPRFQGPGLDLAAVTVPCRTIGGDFYDYLDVGEGRFGFTLGDVSGKGPPAALLAAAVQSIFAAQAPLGGDPAETMTRINRALLRRAIEARFATMFYGVLWSDGRLSYCNAGHESPIIVGRTHRSLETGGVVLGLFDNAKYDVETVQLEAGDTIVVFSDGVSEARNGQDEELGRERLVSALAASPNLSSEGTLEKLLTAVRDFTAGAPQADDVTALVLRYRGAGN
ncbi:MAG TPA: SpoIIE family protein phosphatase [Vicinamibacterales bacterium]|jgi:serine phosphatase RsbU (regulator of sigma subunit)